MDFSCEEIFWEKSLKFIAGVDEAGRGPLAGPVVAAAVILEKKDTSEEFFVKEVNDSKKLTPAKREFFFDIIISKAYAYGIGVCDNKEIDRINILQATLLAMRRAVENLNTLPECVLVDGRDIPFSNSVSFSQKAIINGDNKSPSIAAASIIAKVTRDRMMKNFAVEYPQYEFEKHKGYGTSRHMEILKQIGPCPIHRFSFAPVAECNKK